jgi:hypothetical protein
MDLLMDYSEFLREKIVAVRLQTHRLQPMPNEWHVASPKSYSTNVAFHDFFFLNLSRH